MSHFSSIYPWYGPASTTRTQYPTSRGRPIPAANNPQLFREHHSTDDTEPPPSAFLPSWSSMTADDIEADVRTLVRTPHSMSRIHSDLNELCSSTDGSKKLKLKLQDLVSQLKQSTYDIDQVARHMAQPRFFNEIHTTSASKVTADKLFSVTELTERILSFLDVANILHAMQVNKTFHNVIEGSAKLQRRLRLRPDYPRFCNILETPKQMWESANNADTPIFFPHLRIRIEQVHLRPGKSSRTRDWHPTDFSGLSASDSYPKTSIHAEIDGKWGTSNIIVGERLRKMLICQPPLLKMEAHAACCGSGDGILTMDRGISAYRATLSNKVTSITGITIGDLYDAAGKLAEQHRLCPNARPEMHDENGFVRPTIHFGTEIPLHSEHPLASTSSLAGTATFCHFPVVRPELDDTHSENTRIELDAYMQAKRIAAGKGQQIPTLAEFKEERQAKLEPYRQLLRGTTIGKKG